MSKKITELDWTTTMAANDFVAVADVSANETKRASIAGYFEQGRNLSRGKYLCDQVQRLDCAAEDWTTALDLSDGPAMAKCLWLAVETTDFDARSWKIRITFDGAGSPQIDTTGDRISSMFGGGFTINTTFRARFSGVTANSSTGYSGYFRVQMPYQTSIKIEVYNPDDTVEHCWMQLERTTLTDKIIQHGPPRDMHLYNANITGVIAGLVEETLLDVAGPAILMALTHVISHSAGTTWKFLEGDYRIYYDNEATASYRSSGAEDFYRSSWYFTEGVFANDDIVLSIKDAVNYRVAMRRYFRIEDAPSAEDNLKATWTNGDVGNDPGNVSASSSIWYYK